jgi:signal transduction histidine kinase/CheY-like chemotaxis protein
MVRLKNKGPVHKLLGVQFIHEQCVSVAQMCQIPSVVIDHNLKVTAANPMFYQAFHLSKNKLLKSNLFGTAKNKGLSSPKIEEILQATLKAKTDLNRIKLKYNFPKRGLKNILLSTQKIIGAERNQSALLVSIQDHPKESQTSFRENGKNHLANVLDSITSAANNSMSLAEVSQALLKAICIYTKWDIGHSYLLTSDPNYSTSHTTIHHYHNSKDHLTFWNQFEIKATASQQGLPNEVLHKKCAKWQLDIYKDPRFEGANFKMTGIKAAYAFPVFIESKVAAILEFFSKKNEKPDEQLLKLMTEVGIHIGLVINRKRIEDENAKLLVREHTARSQTEKDNRTKDFFLATLSHELRTPLTSILLWIQILRDEKIGTDCVKEGMAAIEKSALIQEKLINDLLDTSRIIMGKLSLEMCSVNLGKVLSSTIESVKHTLQNKSIVIETLIEPQVETVLADAPRLQQVFWNLLSNSIKFSPPNTAISIRIKQVLENKIPYAEISFEDHGVGIPKEFISQIFDWFQQADNSRIREHNGLGLGLAISKNLVELQGGMIRAHSHGKDQGTTITVLLPVRSIGNQTIKQNYLGQDFLTRLPERQTPHVNLSGVKILLVDNEISIVNALTIILLSMGAEVKSAPSAQQGFQAFKKFKPTLLLCDIAMPLEDGYSLMRRIRNLKESEGRSVPAVALTAYAADADIENALAAGFQQHISKPVDIRELIQVIEQLTIKNSSGNNKINNKI